MKKLFLLATFGAVAVTGNAQYKTFSIDNNSGVRTFSRSEVLTKKVKTTANKTTAAPNRWYDYSDFLNQSLMAELSQEAGFIGFPIWEDTVHQVNYTSGPSNINMLSMGVIFDPSSKPTFNNYDYYPGEMEIGPGDAYRIDSVTLFGLYNRNPSLTSVVDTIRLSFLKGLGGLSSADEIFGGALGGGGHYGAATFVSMRHDSVTNTAKSGTIGYGDAPLHKQDILLTAASMADTNANGVWIKSFAIATPINASANQMIGMSISFKSGANPPATSSSPVLVYDAVTQTATHNIWMPLLSYASDGTDPQWAPYFPATDPKCDSNVGLFKRMPGILGWASQYVPTWAWSSGGGSSASVLQYPTVQFYANCTTCGNVLPDPGSVSNVAAVTNVKAVPNPADNKLNIAFTLGASADVTVTLSNMIGQVVATKTMGNVANGTAEFNTSAMPSGLYTYNVSANGQRNTGSVVIAH